MVKEIKDTYWKNYIKIYVSQTISIILGFVSLFIVVPYLSSNTEIYGIYSICISITVFFSYADLGFLSAGNKYASEFYIRNEKKEEIAYIASSHFILFISAVEKLWGIRHNYISIYIRYIHLKNYRKFLFESNYLKKYVYLVISCLMSPSKVLKRFLR